MELSIIVMELPFYRLDVRDVPLIHSSVRRSHISLSRRLIRHLAADDKPDVPHASNSARVAQNR